MKDNPLSQLISQHRKAIVMGLIAMSTLLLLAWTVNLPQNISSNGFSIATGSPVVASTPTRVFYLNTGTPLPPEYFDTQQQTNQILIGAIIMVLIVIISTIGALLRKRGN
jgi:hypothetical protein